MTESIKNYIDFIKEQYSLEVSIHGDGIIEHLDALAPYNLHERAYCMFVKSSHECWERCIKSQKRAIQACAAGAFFGSCYAGVGEFVFPVFVGAEVVAFVSVGGYVGSSQKRAAFCEKYGFRPEKLASLSAEHLKSEIPDTKFVKTLIDPLCAMVSQLIEKQQGYKGEGAAVYGKILSILHTGYATKIRICDIAEQCHYSEAYVRRHFKANTGISIGKYLLNLRMSKAKSLLTDTAMSIEDIGAACGFSDTNYFISCFSRFYGIPPKKFRNMTLSKN